MPLQSFTVTEDFVFELCQFKQQNSADRQTDRQTDSTVPSAHAGEGNELLSCMGVEYNQPAHLLDRYIKGGDINGGRLYVKSRRSELSVGPKYPP